MSRPTPPLDVSELLVHRDWLRRLARSLVHDELAAEDAVQQTYVAALERPPRDRSNLRAWLATTLRHFAWKERRGQRRREDREARAARPEVDAVARDSAESAELQRRAITLVLELAEPYRSVVLLRFFEDLKAREIAARLGVPVGTVESRLHRAMTRLRAQLDLEYGERHSWVLALVGAKLLPEPAAPIALGTKLLFGGATLAASTVAAITFLPIDEDPSEEDSRTASPLAAVEAAPPADPTAPEGLERFSASMKADQLAAAPEVEKPASDRAELSPLPERKLSSFERSLLKLVDRYWQELEEGGRRADRSLQDIVEAVEREEARRGEVLLADVELWSSVFDRLRATRGQRVKPTSSFELIKSPFEGTPWCLVSVPASADRRGDLRLPLIFCLGPEVDSRRAGPGARSSTQSVATWASDRYDLGLRDNHVIVVLPRFPAPRTPAQESRGPTSVDGERPSWTDPVPIAAALGTLNQVGLLNRHVDLARVLLDSGLEDTPAVLEIGARFPGLFAGALVRSVPLALPNPESPTLLTGPRRHNLRHLRVLYHHTQPGGLYPGHRRTTLASALDAPTIRDFSDSTRKDGTPARVVQHLKTIAEGTAFWLRVTRLDTLRLPEPDHAFVAAEYDRNRGRVVLITHPTVRAVQLYFNDHMLDLDRPILVEHRPSPAIAPETSPLEFHGQIVHQDLVPRDLPLTLDLPVHQILGNPGVVFTASLTLELD